MDYYSNLLSTPRQYYCSYTHLLFHHLKKKKKKTTHDQELLLLRITILFLIYILAIVVRLFSILRYESMIHEYDPYFNYRATAFLSDHGLHQFWNWFDHTTWYPLGRATGATLYPGLMLTTSFLHSVIRSVFRFFPVHIRDVCVLIGPFFASNTTILVYFFVKETWNTSAGLVSAALIAVCPGYTSRSVAGAYDNEAVAIFALVLVFYLFLRAVRTGSMAWAVAAAFGYLYMVSSWGGYVFVVNLIPLYVLVLVVTGRYSKRLYVAYSCMYIVGMLLAMQIRFVGFLHVQSGEHMAAIDVFLFLQVFNLFDWWKHMLKDAKSYRKTLKIAATCALSVGAAGFGIGTAYGYISRPWDGRLYSLLDPTYARDNNPIISSVMEHHPTTWSAFMLDFHVLLFLFPAGLYLCFFRSLTEATIFIILYGLTSIYFAGVMVRLILVATPAMCFISGIAVSSTLRNLIISMVTLSTKKRTSRKDSSTRAPSRGMSRSKSSATMSTKALGDDGTSTTLPWQGMTSFGLLIGALYLLGSYIIHSNWVTSEYYSSPSMVLTQWAEDGSRILHDDYREAYSWIRHNTPSDAKVMAWWDYGYQISAMANRTVIVDNNTWNNTHIALVGKAMASNEDEAYEIMLSLDVDYVLVVFGGVTGYQQDDIDKFLWMVRIAEGVFPDNIRERDYLVDGDYRIDQGATPKVLNSLLYKLCYYRFGEMYTQHGEPSGFDRARGVGTGNGGLKLTHLEEAYTTSNWIIRIYKVKPRNNRW